MEMKNIKEFLNIKNTIGFIGATIQKEKWGYKKYKELKDAGFKIYPINPKYDKIDGDRCFPTLFSLIKYLNKNPDLVITVVPPQVTEKVVEQCKNYGIDKIWMQPGSESKKAVDFCKDNNINVIQKICIVMDALKKL